MKYLLCILLFVGYASCLLAQQDTTKTIEDINLSDDIGLEELMNVKLTVASQKELTIKQTPAIVTVLTREDIEQSAARDIMDVLRLVPGLDFGLDVNGEIGLGVRGIWATEGKVLVMLDGLQMNENMYGTTEWIAQFDLNQIDHIEIIRGPGYAAYNGFASLAVINIITKKAKDLQGLETNIAYGRLLNTFSRKIFSTQIGIQQKDFAFKGSFYTGEVHRHEGTYSDMLGNTIQLDSGNADIAKPLQFNLFAAYKKLEVKYYFNNNKNTVPFILSNLLKTPANSDFYTRQFDVRHTWKINEKITLKPHANINFNRPWTSNDFKDTTDSEYFFYDKSVMRYSGDLTENVALSNKIQLNATHGFFLDRAKGNTEGQYEANLVNDKNLVTYSDWFNALELFLHFTNTTVSLGLRQEKHSAFGNVFLPRIALTQTYKKFNFKAAYSHAFRAPLVENILANDKIKPELTLVTEFQVGYSFNDNFYTSLNLYEMDVDNPIIYNTMNGVDNYFNLSKLGTSGGEFEIHGKNKYIKITGSYAYYFNEHDDSTDVTFYWAKDRTQLTGFANHKLGLSLKWNIAKNFEFSASSAYIGKRYAYTSTDADGKGIQSQLNSNCIINTVLRMHSLNKVKGLAVSFGCYDVLDTDYKYVQPYDGGKAPMGALCREFLLKLTYSFTKKM